MDFPSFYSNEFKKFRVEFYSKKFLIQKVNIQNHKTLSFIVKMVLTLSHGQASVERQFLVNHQVLDNNMQMMRIVVLKYVINHVETNQPTSHSINISKNLLFSVKSVFSRYRIYLEEEKEKKANTEVENQKAIKSNDMTKLKDQCDSIKRAITMAEQDVNECVLLAESRKNSAYVVRSNTLKKKCDESNKKS